MVNAARPWWWPRASSGHGKTTVATGLMAALRARGLAASGHKVGPDYIDPGYHALATARPAGNLDPVLCGEDQIAPLLAHSAAGARSRSSRVSWACSTGVAARRRAPRRTSRGCSARPWCSSWTPPRRASRSPPWYSGFASYDPGVRLAEEILNRVGSARHEEILRDALAGIGVPVLGTLRRDDAIAVPSRHLGLVPVAEREDAAQPRDGPARGPDH